MGQIMISSNMQRLALHAVRCIAKLYVALRTSCVSLEIKP